MLKTIFLFYIILYIEYPNVPKTHVYCFPHFGIERITLDNQSKHFILIKAQLIFIYLNKK